MNKKKKFLLLFASQKSALPSGYTALDYLESSGTQYINTGIATDGKFTISCRLQVASGGAVWGRACTPPHADYTGGQSWARFLAPNDSNKGLWFYYNYVGTAFSNNASKPPTWDISQPHDWVAVEGEKTVMLDGENVTLGTQYNYTVNVENPDQRTHFIFATNGDYIYGTGKATMKLYSFTMQDGFGRTVLALIPALRNADSIPGMWDTVSKTFFTNAGSGTFGYRIKTTGETVSPMARRDPYRVAPSGVWARPAGENELELLADTEETTGDGWEWFPDTAEAMEHFGIIMSEQMGQ